MFQVNSFIIIDYWNRLITQPWFIPLAITTRFHWFQPFEFLSFFLIISSLATSALQAATDVKHEKSLVTDQAQQNLILESTNFGCISTISCVFTCSISSNSFLIYFQLIQLSPILLKHEKTLQVNHDNYIKQTQMRNTIFLLAFLKTLTLANDCNMRRKNQMERQTKETKYNCILDYRLSCFTDLNKWSKHYLKEIQYTHVSIIKQLKNNCSNH